MGKQKLFPEKSADELLTEFQRSGAQAPFEEIVRRYAGMVYSVCYRVTANAHDAEDATQAVFLSLAMQAKANREIRMIGPWLQRVAHRLALDVKKSKSRRTKREQKLAEINGAGEHRAQNPADFPADQELRLVMQEELSAMPAKYRMPLLLHYFGGMSREEMARELNTKPATLGVRVHRGRAMLGKRLAKRGIAIGASLPIVIQDSVRSFVGERLIQRSTWVAVNGTPHHVVAAQMAASRAIALVRLIAKASMYAKLRAAVAITLVITVAGALAGPSVVESVKAMQLQLMRPLDLSRMVRPLLRMLLPSPRADATPAKENPSSGATGPVLVFKPVESQSTHVTVLPVQSSQTAPTVAAVASMHSPAPAPAPNPASENKHVRAIEEYFPAPSHVAGGNLSPSPSHQSDPIAIATADRAPSHSSPVERIVDGQSSGHLALGGGSGGDPELYLLPENHTLHAASETIGASGFAAFHQSGGTHKVDGDLVLAQSKGSRAQYDLTGGALDARGEVVGDQGSATVHQTAGANTFDRMVIGDSQSGDGTYLLDGDGVIRGAQITVGMAGVGTLAQDGGTILLHASTADAAAPYISSYFSANNPSVLELATTSTSTGTFALTSGKIYFDSGQYAPQLKIGVGGKGILKLGGDDSSGQIAEGRLVHTSLVVRARDGGSGTLSGWGDVGLTGTLINNGKVIADGFNHDRTLDLSHFTRVTSKIENPDSAGAHGWIARRKGAISLPPVSVHAGTDTYTWGENQDDPLIDLVNSVRFTVHDAAYPGEISIKLLSIDRDDVPTLPKPHHFIGVWSFDPSDIAAAGGFDFTVRYDDGLAASEGLNENILKFWAFDAGSWHRIVDASLFRDVQHNLIGAHVNRLSYFAVSAPEPGAAVMLMIASAGMILRRRRSR